MGWDEGEPTFCVKGSLRIKPSELRIKVVEIRIKVHEMRIKKDRLNKSR